jgi:ATP-binding cassette, subfamily B, bacterial
MKFSSTKNWGNRYRRLLKYSVSYWKGWILILIVTLLSSATSLLQPWPLKILVDYVFDQKPVPAGIKVVLDWIPWTATGRGLLFWAAASGLFIFAVNTAFSMFLTFSWIRVGRKMVYDLMRDIFANVQRRSLIFHARSSVGDLMSRITGDSWCIYTVSDTLLFAPVQALVVTAAMAAVMAQINLKLTLMALAVAPLMTVVSLFFGKKIRKIARQKRESESRIQSHVQQTLSGITVVKAFAQEDREHFRFREFTEAALEAQKRSKLTGSFYNLLAGGFNSLGKGLILYLGAYDVMAGRMTIGSLLVFISYLGTLQGQLKSFSGIYSNLQSAGASVDRVVEVLDTEEDVKNDPRAPKLAGARGHVRFEQVRFGYEAGRAVLEDISFEALPGQTIAVVGQTGAGKSTLVSLIPRFADVWTGKVTIDGRDVRDVELDSLRSQVAIVLQEPFLFPLSIAENIAYGKPRAGHREIEAAAAAANAHEFIERLPEGYETVIGERGATLSGGERQRLSIARALLRDAPVLILDEPTSALDARTESLLLEALERLMRNRTTFIIAHRLSTIRRADRILVLDKGRLVENGTHAELLAKGGIYASFYEIQFGSLQRVDGAI